MMSTFSGVNTFQGKVTIQSKYVRVTVYSAAAGDIRPRRPSFALRFFLGFFSQARGLDLLSKFLDLPLGVVALAQLALNRAQLFAKKVFALALSDFFLNLILDFASKLENLEFFSQFGVQELQALSTETCSRTNCLATIERFGRFVAI
jgi:hypothetical protein